MFMYNMVSAKVMQIHCLDSLLKDTVSRPTSGSMVVPVMIKMFCCGCVQLLTYYDFIKLLLFNCFRIVGSISRGRS